MPISGLTMGGFSLEEGYYRSLCPGCCLGLRHLVALEVGESQGGLLAQELNRMESALGRASGRLKEGAELRRGPGWGSSGQPQMGEDLDHHGGLLDGGNERQGAAALRTVGHVDLEHPFE